MPSRSTVSSKVVGGRTGLNTASRAASRCTVQRYIGKSNPPTAVSQAGPSAAADIVPRRERPVRPVAARPARPSGDLPDRRQRPAGRPDPRDGELVAPLGGRGAAPRRRLHGDRARPDRPRRLGHAPRRLLARRPRGEHSRPARRDRSRQRDDRRPLARRRRGDAVLLPVPPARGANGAGLERRARPRGEPDAPRRGAARRGRPALARRPPASRWRGCRRRASGCGSAARGRASTCRPSPGHCSHSSGPAPERPSCRRCGR